MAQNPEARLDDKKSINKVSLPEPDQLLGYKFGSPKFRVLSSIPGLISGFFILLPIFTILFRRYSWFVNILFFVVFYWFYRGVLVLYGVLVGYIRYLLSKKVDWNHHLSELFKKENWGKLPTPYELPDNPDKFKVVVLIPVYREPEQVLRESLESLRNSDFPIKERLIVVFALEERGGKEVHETVKKLKEEYEQYFYDLRYYIHPANIPGEVVGIAGPNLRWASYHFWLDIKKKGLSSQNYFVLKYDADFLVTSKFLSALTYLFLTTPNRIKRYFTTALLLYSNNIWRVSPFTRVFSVLLTFGHLAEWVVFPRQKKSFSMYAMSLKTLEDVHFWDPKIGVDDTGFFYQAYIRYEGDFEGRAIYLPGTMDALEGVNLKHTLSIFYKQQLRWGAGVVVIPMLLSVITKLKTSTWQKIKEMYYFFEIYTFWKVFSLYFLFYFPFLALIFEGVLYRSEFFLIAYYISKVFYYARWLSPFVLLIVLLLYREYAPKDKYNLIIRWIIFLIEFSVIFSFNTVTFTFFPYIQAQVDLMRGRWGRYTVVPKLRGNP